MPTAKGIIITILGAISQAGVVDISLKTPQAMSASKKRKANDHKSDDGKWSGWNKNRAFSRLSIERDGCARYERYEGTLFGNG